MSFKTVWTRMAPDEEVYCVECGEVATLTRPIGVRPDGFEMEETVCPEHGPEWMR